MQSPAALSFLMFLCLAQTVELGDVKDCPRRGYALSTVIATPSDSGIFTQCDQDIEEPGQIQNCTFAAWSNIRATAWHYCGPGAYMADYRQDQVADNTTSDFSFSAKCCTTHLLCSNPSCIFPRQPINKCNSMGTFSVNKTIGYIGAMATAYCSKSGTRSFRVQYCSCNVSADELESQIKLPREAQPSDRSRPGHAQGQVPPALEQRGEQSRGGGGGAAMAVGLGLPLALGLGFGLSGGSRRVCNVTAGSHVVVLGGISNRSYIFKPGECARLSCMNGYSPKGTFELCCNNAILNGSQPNCQPDSCLISFPNGNVTGDATASGPLVTISSGHCASFSCKTGLNPGNTQSICCSLGKVDSAVPVCTPMSCSIGPFPNGSVSGQFTGSSGGNIVVTNGQCATFACFLGFEPTLQTVVCCSNGQATPSPPVCQLPPPCAPINAFTNGYVTGTIATYTGNDTTMTINSGQCATFTCSYGYLPTSPSLVCCSSGALSGPIPLCTIQPSCNVGLFNTTAGTMRNSSDAYTASGNGITINSGKCVTFSCNPGYTPNGTFTSCCVGGALTGAVPVCLQEKSCVVTSFDSVNNGTISGDIVQVQGSSSFVILSGHCGTFSCKPGFTPTGNYYGCCDNGQLSTAVPFCYKGGPCTFTIPLGANITGQIAIPTASAGQPVTLNNSRCTTLTCSQQYVQLTVTTCCNSGQLSRGVPFCVLKKSCSIVGTTGTALVSGDLSPNRQLINPGGCVSFQCPKDTLPINPQVVCCVDGAIHDIIPACSQSATCKYRMIPSIDYGTYQGSMTTGQSDWFSCAAGYTGGQTFVSCDSGVLSAPFPSCVYAAASCTYLDLSSHHILGNAAPMPNGTGSWFRCAPDYTSGGDKWVECHNGFLNGEFPDCVYNANFCNLPPGNESIATNGITRLDSKTSYTFGCNTGYSGGQASWTCNNGVLSGQYPACVPAPDTCNVPVAPNGEWTAGAYTLLGGKSTTVSCNCGMKFDTGGATESRIITCDKATLTVTKFNCIAEDCNVKFTDSSGGSWQKTVLGANCITTTQAVLASTFSFYLICREKQLYVDYSHSWDANCNDEIWKNYYPNNGYIISVSNGNENAFGSLSAMDCAELCLQIPDCQFAGYKPGTGAVGECAMTTTHTGTFTTGAWWFVKKCYYP